MAQLEYSIDAVNVLSKFYRADALVYVEGDDDIPFWSAVFAGVESGRVTVESAGGSEEVEKLVLRIEREGAKLVVARDADYTLYSGTRSGSNRVVYSYGHSIENSLYTRAVIKRIAHLLHRKSAPKDEDVSAWIDSLVQALRPVVVNDLASELDNLGVVALSDNCESFMVNRSSPLTSAAKIEARLARIERQISQESRDRAEQSLSRHGGYHELLLRGHVFASAVLRFVREHAGRNVSYETLYTTAMTMFEQELKAGHPHAGHYARVAKHAVDSLMAA
ncbi:DUF4435 domain-containing protein [Dyella sp. Tek66A03]|uniref:DUF4435 domain-containing protein n=1 Tax=Dyella sp. Tek66A03 TaxID=3458298 RepID=UPI00403E8B70